MALNSLDAVKRRIQALQQQADEAEDRAQLFQKELDEERDVREKVRLCAFSLPNDERFADESIPVKDSLHVALALGVYDIFNIFNLLAVILNYIFNIKYKLYLT